MKARERLYFYEAGAVKNLHTGRWAKGYTRLTVPANRSLEIRAVCAGTARLFGFVPVFFSNRRGAYKAFTDDANRRQQAT